MKKKADHVFHKERKQQIELRNRPTEPNIFYWKQATNQPIYFPKRKKKK